MKRTFMNKGYLRRTALIQAGLWLGCAGFAFGEANKVSERRSGVANLKMDTRVESRNQLVQEISGQVTDEQNAGIPGVTVLVKGTSVGTSTDQNGKFTIEITDKDAILVFSYVGFATQEVPIGTKSEINVQLVLDDRSLNEIVVVGYGTQTKREISGSITNISQKDFNQGVTRNAVDLLQGKVAGLTITKGSGDISRDQTIRLRGTSSLTGSSQPFVVIDGVPGVSMNSVAPQDIESISVLKDASAAAIYGSRSASGVILITTKKGKKDKTTVDYEGYVAFDKVSNIPDVLDAATWREYTKSKNINTDGIDKGGDTDWFREIMRTGVTQNHSLSLSGGGKNNQYRASFSSLGQQGVVKKNDMQRYNARLSFSQKALNDKLNLMFAGAITERNYSPTDTRNFILAYNMLPVAPVKNEDGSWYDTMEYDQGNPLRNITYNTRDHKNSLYYTNIKADLDITPELVVGANLLKQRESNDYGEFNHSDTERGRNDQGFAKRESWTSDKKLMELTLNYKKIVGAHNFNFLAGYSYEENDYQKAGSQNRQFVTNFFGYHNLGAGENLRPADVWSEANMNKLISAFGRINYMLLDKYILTASVRRDGSTKFGKNHKWGTFPSVSVAWALKDEPFLIDVNAVDDMKLRVGYGLAGNQAGLDPYKSLQLYGQSGQYYDGGKWYKAYQISQNANPNLKWETTAMFNVGIDYSLFNSRINGTIEYYDKKTSDLLYTYRVPVPPYLFSDMIANVGEMTNKGIEFQIGGDIIRKSDLRWTMSVNLAHNVNKITKLSNEEFSTNSIKTGTSFIRGGSDNTTHIVEEGKAVGTFYGWVSKGLDDAGKYILDDMIDGKPGLTDEDRTYIGSAQPKLTYGISNVVSYKNLELNFFLRGVYGNDLLNFSRMAYATTQWLPGANVLKAGLTNGLTDNPKYSSYYIEKGSFLRMDNLSLAYNINPKGFLGFEKLRVYVTGQNLFLITKYTGLDPEIEMSGLDPGIEGREYYPKSRTVSVGINLSF
jgi:TonB-linked SusC/RagA family outer membrane protein